MIPVETIGWLGQGLFTARVLHQWIASERTGRSVLPPGYWELSLAASAVVLTYATFVEDPVFQLSLVPGAVVAARNLRIQRPSTPTYLVPLALVLFALVLGGTLLGSPTASPPVTILGGAGSFLWGSRLIVQWWESERRGRSTLSGRYWTLSLLGGALLLVYAVVQGDAVMIAGYGFGCIPYLRNLALLRRGGTPRRRARVPSLR